MGKWRRHWQGRADRGWWLDMKTLGQTLVKGNNNFDLIRLLAALSVMLGHSYGLQYGGGFEWMLSFSHLESFSSLAVYGFFLISGMLVSASFVRSASVWKFMGLRAFRIWPAAIVCAGFIAFLAAPAVSALPLQAYFSHTQVYGWLLRNASLMGRTGGPLPGVFEHNHLTGLVNATVWTLPVELECYLLVLLAGLSGALATRAGTALAVLVAGLAFAGAIILVPDIAQWSNFFLLPIAYSFYPVPFFMLGMLLYGFRDYIPLRWEPVAALSVCYALTRYSAVSTALFYVLFAYGLLWFASLDGLKRFKPRHDYSYGIYLYGFVVQQVVAQYFPTMNHVAALALSIPFAVGLAALSWHFIERPSLAVLRKPRARVPPLSAPVEEAA